MSVVIPSLRGAIAVPGWAKNDLWRKARAVPSLDLRFADNKSLTDAVTGASLVTFTRASDGTFVDSAGVLQTAATDVPRFDHNPTTGESLGLLVEEQRTNSIRNNTMVGAVAGTPGTMPTNWVESAIATGLTRQVVGIGTSNGIAYIDVKVSGTTSSAAGWSIFFDAGTQIAASSGQVWTGATYVAIIAGSTANITNALIRIVERNSGGGYITESNISYAAATASLINNRFSFARTLGATAAFVQYGVYFQAASGVAIDITLRIGLPQLEQGAFATSPILTSTAAVTRSADVASITGSAFSGWYRQDEGTFFVDVPVASSLTDTRYALDVSDGTFGNGIFIAKQLNTQVVARARVSNADTFVATGDGVPWVGNEGPRRMAFALSASSARFATQGALRGSDQSGITMPTVNRMNIGSLSSAFILNSPIRRLTFWGQRLSNSTLQTLTQ